MDKISSILPSSARITSVDLKEGSALRPGVPSFGRTEGVSGRNRDRAQLGETAVHASEIQQKQLNWREKDVAQAAMAQEVSRNFFGNRTKEAEQGGEVKGVKDEFTGGDERDGSAARSSAPGAASNAIVAATRDLRSETRESRPTGFRTEELAGAIKARNFHPDVSFDEDEARTTIMDPSFFPSKKSTNESVRQQPDGLYPKGSFIDRTA